MTGSQPPPPPTPLFEAAHADRYERQQLIRAYQEKYECRLVVVVDAIFPDSVTAFEELVYEADPAQDLHFMIVSPGGDGESAVRILRAAQARCRELVVVVPDEAKSAATLLAIGAHTIMMGPTSDLGPIDPQMRLGEHNELTAAKDIIAAVDDAAAKVQGSPGTYALYSSLLSDVTAIRVQQARSALSRTTKLLDLALHSNTNRTDAECKRLQKALTKALIEEADYHAGIFGIPEAEAVGLPVLRADPSGEQWDMIWRLWARYFVLGHVHAYEGERASNVMIH